MTGLEQLKVALAKKNGSEEKPKPKVPLPDPIVFAVAGTYTASDGLDYTITYDTV